MTNTLWYSIANPFGAVTVEDFAAVILSCYLPVSRQYCSISDTSTTQVCGAWVSILPTLVDSAQSSKLVTSAVRTLGVAVLARTPEGNRIAFQNLEAYGSTLYYLKDALLSTRQCFLETLTAISCLAMSEVRAAGSLQQGHTDICHAAFVVNFTERFRHPPRWTRRPYCVA